MTGNEEDRADLDRRFAEIVRRLQDPETQQEPEDPRPATGEEHAEPEQPPAVPEPDERDGRDEEDGTAAPPSQEGAPAAWRSWQDADEQEHYVPPPPPPLPAGDLHLWGIVAGLLGGPLVLVLAHVLQLLDSAFWTWLGLGLGLGGFWLLWLRLPTQRDDGPHGGAQV